MYSARWFSLDSNGSSGFAVLVPSEVRLRLGRKLNRVVVFVTEKLPFSPWGLLFLFLRKLLLIKTLQIRLVPLVNMTATRNTPSAYLPSVLISAAANLASMELMGGNARVMQS